MPIEKILIVHKFGIISQTQRIELQERLLKQSSASSQLKAQYIQVATKYPLEITDEFIHQFNTAISHEDVVRLENRAEKMLARAKRRAGRSMCRGMKEFGKGYHVDLPFAWTELSQLAQCKGKIQEDCLDVLIGSLDQSPMNRSQIPALFFLAETCLYWLRTEAMNETYLRSSEMKILEMGYLVFMRLFYHHMAGQLVKHEGFKNRLFTYMEGFEDCQESYNPYPNALLFLRYVNEVGKMILSYGGAAPLDPGEVKEGDPGAIQETHTQEDIEESVEEMFREVSVHFADEESESPGGGGGGGGSGAGGLSSSVHDLSPSLWHALDVWRCTHQLSGGLPEALHALACCGIGLASETWVDGICALYIMGEAAKVNLSTLRVLQDLARGLPPPQSHTAHTHKGATSASTTATGSLLVRQCLSDIYEKTETGSSREHGGAHYDDDDIEEDLEGEDDEEELNKLLVAPCRVGASDDDDDDDDDDDSVDVGKRVIHKTSTVVTGTSPSGHKRHSDIIVQFKSEEESGVMSGWRDWKKRKDESGVGRRLRVAAAGGGDLKRDVRTVSEVKKVKISLATRSQSPMISVQNDLHRADPVNRNVSACVKPNEKMSVKMKPNEKMSVKMKPNEKMSVKMKPNEKMSVKMKPNEKMSVKMKPNEKMSVKMKPNENMSVNNNNMKPNEKMSVNNNNMKPNEKMSVKMKSNEKMSVKMKSNEKMSVKMKPNERMNDQIKSEERMNVTSAGERCMSEEFSAAVMHSNMKHGATYSSCSSPLSEDVSTANVYDIFEMTPNTTPKYQRCMSPDLECSPSYMSRTSWPSAPGQHHEKTSSMDLERLRSYVSRTSWPSVPGLHHEKTSSTLDSHRGGGGKLTNMLSRNTTSGWKAEVGSAADHGMSETSSKLTFTNDVDEKLSGLQGWHWELVITYANLLADIVLNGNSSTIQKVALVGSRGGTAWSGYRQPQCPMTNAGLIDLVSFQAMQETLDGSNNDWSWRVRYTAVRALVRLCQGTASDVLREGLHNAVYSVLQRAKVTERDSRVLEAIKVEQLMASQQLNMDVAIGSRLASGLVRIYLPPLPPPIQTPPLKKHPRSMKSSPQKRSGRKTPLRTSLKEEIALATALYEPPIPFTDKTDFDLKRIVEDQLRKELHEKLEEEEEERKTGLQENRKEAENNERLLEESRKAKMKNRFKGKSDLNKKSPSGGQSRSSLTSVKSLRCLQVKQDAFDV